jgi:hypothetical protein
MSPTLSTLCVSGSCRPESGPTLGAALDWPGVEALLLLDSFEPGDQPALWRNLGSPTPCGFSHSLWVLPHILCGFSFKLDQLMSSAGLTQPHSKLCLCSACQCAVLNAKRRVIHQDNCVMQSGIPNWLVHETQLWRVSVYPCKDLGSGWWSRPQREVVLIPVQGRLGELPLQLPLV